MKLNEDKIFRTLVLIFLTAILLLSVGILALLKFDNSILAWARASVPALSYPKLPEAPNHQWSAAQVFPQRTAEWPLKK